MPNNFEIIFDASTLVTATGGGAFHGSLEDRLYVFFDADGVQTVISNSVRLPSSYTGTGTLKADIAYFSPAATGGIRWEVSIEAVTEADALDLSTTSSFDSVNPLTATVPATANRLDVATVTLTNKDSLAAGDIVRVKLTRNGDHADDTAAGGARMVSMTLYEEQ